MTDTATKILDAGQFLIQTRGYSAVSFQDIATKVGIKKPSIIHHFENKCSLGVAIIQRYRSNFAEQLEAIKNDPDKTSWDSLEFYFSPYFHFASTPDQVCLCGALSGEVTALPEEMRIEVKLFMEAHQLWLKEILINGLNKQEMNFDMPPIQLARMIFNSLQGALLVKRSTDDLNQIEDVRRTIIKMLAA
ncbi:TetR/AcrR family transcriptional regulator [Gammaproteobacteria bacterium]|nr:TetR/AcrR family transcriptional regulator [Gammaproteobacteria bacterium]